MTQAQEPEPSRTGGAVPERPPGVPGWVKVSALVAVILLVGLIVAMLIGGNHGPGRHTSAPTAGENQNQTGARSDSLGIARPGVW